MFSGGGAKEYGGRWNAIGIAMVYTSSTASLALLETLVHVDPAALPASIVATKLYVPNDVTARELTESNLHDGWRDVDDKGCAELGSDWARSNVSLLLHVPSAVNPLERNVLINPVHPEIARCELQDVVDVVYDTRLIALIVRSAS